MFNENSCLVKIWARKVKEGVVVIKEDIPRLFNLYHEVIKLIDEK